MTLGEIIKKYRESHDMSMDDFSRASGISKAYISMLEKNKGRTGKVIVPTIETIKKVAGAMYMSYDEVFGMLDNNLPVSTATDDIVTKKSIMIPVLGKVAAGIPFEAIENVIDYEEISESMARSGEFFALRIKGDSMEPEIHNGDTVVVRKQADAESGDIIIVLVNGNDATCKRLIKYTDGIRLMPINPTYEPMYYTDTEIEDKPVKIVGKVIENRRRY